MGQVTLLTGPERHHRSRDEEREEILSAAFAPGVSVAEVARRFEVATSLICKWRQQSRASDCSPSSAPAVVAEEAAQLAATAPSDRATIVVKLLSGILVTIGAAATAAIDALLLRTVELMESTQPDGSSSVAATAARHPPEPAVE